VGVCVWLKYVCVCVCVCAEGKVLVGWYVTHPGENEIEQERASERESLNELCQEVNLNMH